MIMSLFFGRTWEWKKVCYDTNAEDYRSSHRSVPALKSWWNLNHDTWTKPHIMENPPSSISRSSIPNVCIPLPCHSKYADFWSELARSPATAGSKWFNRSRSREVSRQWRLKPKTRSSRRSKLACDLIPTKSITRCSQRTFDEIDRHSYVEWFLSLTVRKVRRPRSKWKKGSSRGIPNEVRYQHRETFSSDVEQLRRSRTRQSPSWTRPTRSTERFNS